MIATLSFPDDGLCTVCGAPIIITMELINYFSKTNSTFDIYLCVLCEIKRIMSESPQESESEMEHLHAI